MRQRLGAYVVTGGGLMAGALLAAPGAAWASWSTESDGGSATVRAAELPAVGTPRVTLSERRSSVVVRWPEASVVRGVPVETYRVARIDRVTGDRVDLTGSCRGLITGIRCTDIDVPDGVWTYRVRAVLGGWTGSWSPVSATVVVDSAPVKAPEPRPEVKPEPKPETKPETKPEPKPETKPEPEPTKSTKPQPAPQVPDAAETPAAPEATEPEPGKPEEPAETTAADPGQD